MCDLLTGTLGMRMGLTVVLGTVLKQFGVDAACVLFFDRNSVPPRYAAEAGLQTAVLLAGAQNGGRARANGAGEVATLADHAAVMTDVLDVRPDHFAARYSWPLIAEGQLLGALQVFRRSRVKPDAAWHTAMNGVATRFAASIGEAQRAGGPEFPSRN
jgi:hypothetical protein